MRGQLNTDVRAWFLTHNYNPGRTRSGVCDSVKESGLHRIFHHFAVFYFQELSESEEKTFKQKNNKAASDLPPFKGVLGKIISKAVNKQGKNSDFVKEVEAKLEKPVQKAPETKALETKAPETKALETKAPETKSAEKDLKAESLKAVKELFKFDEKEGGNPLKHLFKANITMNVTAVKDEATPYPMGSMISHGHKPPCICPDKSNIFIDYFIDIKKDIYT